MDNINSFQLDEQEREQIAKEGLLSALDSLERIVQTLARTRKQPIPDFKEILQDVIKEFGDLSLHSIVDYTTVKIYEYLAEVSGDESYLKAADKEILAQDWIVSDLMI